MNIPDNISINTHSSIRIAGEKVLYFDPYEIGGGKSGADASFHDADIVFVTHKHYDHFDPESIRKVKGDATIIVAPLSIKEDVLGAGFDEEWCEFLEPYEEAEIDGLNVLAVPSYNTNKPNHLKEFGWLGYVVTMKSEEEDIRYYVAGDTDDNEDIRDVKCDVALVPVGGTYTMDVKEAATFAQTIKPRVAIPTHYGSIVGRKSCGKKFAKALNKLDSEIESRILL